MEPGSRRITVPEKWLPSRLNVSVAFMAGALSPQPESHIPPDKTTTSQNRPDQNRIVSKITVICSIAYQIILMSYIYMGPRQEFALRTVRPDAGCGLTPVFLML
jgi:hypothetical protein